MSVTGVGLSSTVSSWESPSDKIDLEEIAKTVPLRLLQAASETEPIHQPTNPPQPRTPPAPPMMANSTWNKGEITALSLGLVLIFALCFGFRIWWGRRRRSQKGRKQQQTDVEAPPPPLDQGAQNAGRQRPKRDDNRGLILLPPHVVKEQENRVRRQAEKRGQGQGQSQNDLEGYVGSLGEGAQIELDGKPVGGVAAGGGASGHGGGGSGGGRGTN